MRRIGVGGGANYATVFGRVEESFRTKFLPSRSATALRPRRARSARAQAPAARSAAAASPGPLRRRPAADTTPAGRVQLGFEYVRSINRHMRPIWPSHGIMAIAPERCVLPPLRCMLRELVRRSGGAWAAAEAAASAGRAAGRVAVAAPRRRRRLWIQPLAAMDALPAAFAAYGSSIEPAGVGAVSLRRQSVLLDRMRGSTSPSSTNGCNVS
jgi:hypothetical protein